MPRNAFNLKLSEEDIKYYNLNKHTAFKPQTVQDHYKAVDVTEALRSIQKDIPYTIHRGQGTEVFATVQADQIILGKLINLIAMNFTYRGSMDPSFNITHVDSSSLVKNLKALEPFERQDCMDLPGGYKHPFVRKMQDIVLEDKKGVQQLVERFNDDTYSYNAQGQWVGSYGGYDKLGYDINGCDVYGNRKSK